MESYWWLFIVILCCIILPQIELHKQGQQMHIKRIRRRRKGLTPMSEALQRYVGKECVIYISNGSGVAGVVKSVESGWLAMDTGKRGKENINMINTDYIMRIHEK